MDDSEHELELSFKCLTNQLMDNFYLIGVSFYRNGPLFGRRSKAKLQAARLLVLPCGFFYVTWGPWFILTLWAVAASWVVEPHGLERFVQAF